MKSGNNGNNSHHATFEGSRNFINIKAIIFPIFKPKELADYSLYLGFMYKK